MQTHQERERVHLTPVIFLEPFGGCDGNFPGTDTKHPPHLVEMHIPKNQIFGLERKQTSVLAHCDNRFELEGRIIEVFMCPSLSV